MTWICDLGWYPDTPLATPPPLTPSCEPHEPSPSGYIAHSDWAGQMAETHDQRACKGCGRYYAWTPKEKQA
jgi:hypothetical protein